MINNFMCQVCDKIPVCKVHDLLYKFHEDNKKSLGVEITMNRCSNYAEDTAEGDLEAGKQ